LRNADRRIRQGETASQDRAALFRGRHFEDFIVILCVQWYLRYSLSYRYLQEMMAARGLPVEFRGSLVRSF
jgi:hypothetical protein